MNSKNLFRIGELSKLFDIGVDSIRYYEKVGLLKPVRDEQSNYRLYTVDDVRVLSMVRELISLNFSTEQIKNFETDRNVKKTKDMLSEELFVIENEIDELTKKRINIENRLTSLDNGLIHDDFLHVRLINLKKRACFMLHDDNIPDDYVDFYIVKYMHSKQMKINTIGACDCYTLDLENSNPESKYFRTKNVFFYSETENYQSNYYLPAGKYLSLFYKGDHTNTKINMPKLFEYARNNNLEIIGDPIEFCHIDEYETDYKNEYLTEIQVAVK